MIMNPQEITILTVDDTPANVRLLTHYLEKQGYNVLTAEDGFEGFKAAIQYHPDLILLDVMMPGTDGYEVCELLKTEEETRDIPVMFLTAKTDVEDKIRGFELGAVDYITKPFNLVEISTRVKNQLDFKFLKEQNKRYHHILFNMQRLASLGLLSDAVAGMLCSLLSDKEMKLDIISNMAEEWNNLSDHGFVDQEPIPFRKLIEDTADILRDETNESLNIECEFDDDIAEFSGNFIQIQQGITGMMINAHQNLGGIGTILIKISMSSLPETLKKSVKGHESGQYIQIDVVEKESKYKDNLEPEHDLFIWNSKTNNGNVYLSAAHWVAKSHHGAIRIQAGKEAGQTVSMFLPAETE